MFRPLFRSFSSARSHRAMVLKSPGGVKNLEITTRETRSPAGTEMLVKVHACGVSYLDIMNRIGAFPFIKTPVVLGHEIAGTVEEVGPDCRAGMKPGDRVVSVHWAQYDSWPSLFGQSGPVKSILGIFKDGGNQEYLTACESTFAKFNSTKWDAASASTIPSTYGTVWEGLVKRCNLSPTDTVLVTGASGGVGSAAIQIAKSFGCKVIAVTSSTRKQSYVKNLGADVVITDPNNYNMDEAVRSINGVDLVIECTGGPTFVQSMRSLKPEGTLLLVGNLAGHFAKLPLGLTILKSLRIIGSDSIDRNLIDECVQHLDKHNIKPHIQSVEQLDNLASVHLALERKQVCGRVVLKISKDSDW